MINMAKTDEWGKEKNIKCECLYPLRSTGRVGDGAMVLGPIVLLLSEVLRLVCGETQPRLAL